MPPDFWSAPRLWPGETVAIVGSGPSRRAVDVWRIRRARSSNRLRIIAINREGLEIPDADVWYACDAAFWRVHDGPHEGLKIGLCDHPGVLPMREGPETGLALAPDTLALGGASGHQALNLAFHLGAARVVLYGFDCIAPADRPHWFGRHEPGLKNPLPPAVARWLSAFPVIAADLAARGVAVVNATGDTALTCFPRAALEDCL